MNQPWIYMCSLSRYPLPPPSPSHPSGSSQCTSPEHLSHASNLGWRSVSHLIVYLFQCSSLRTSHPNSFMFMILCSPHSSTGEEAEAPQAARWDCDLDLFWLHIPRAKHCVATSVAVHPSKSGVGRRGLYGEVLFRCYKPNQQKQGERAPVRGEMTHLRSITSTLPMGSPPLQP